MAFQYFLHHHRLNFILLLIYITAITTATTSVPPKALLLPVTRDPSTLQYTTNFTQRTPPFTITLTLDLGTQFLWVRCGKRYVSSTYRPVPCNSTLCSLVNTKTCRMCNNPSKPGCNSINTCRTRSLYNPITNIYPATGGELATDVIRVTSTDGTNPGPALTFTNIPFVCAPHSLLKGLAKGVQGVAGLGRSLISLPSQLSKALHTPTIFAICLSSTSNENGGVIFIGDGPYYFNYGIDVVTVLSYTPLITNPFRTSEYFIGVKGVKIWGNDVPLNMSLLSIDNKGNGGTMISFAHPYTIMESSIYKLVTTMFHNILKKSNSIPKRVDPVAPFEVCYDPLTIPSIRIGPQVPDIDLVVQSASEMEVVWRISGMNSMVMLNEAYCLGLVDGGKNARTAIVIGGYQLEDNMLQFDLDKSRLGFSSSLLFSRTRCNNFNFTSTK